MTTPKHGEIERLRELEAKASTVGLTCEELSAFFNKTFPCLLAIAEAAKKVRHIKKQRDEDERNYAAAGQTYGIDELSRAVAELDTALAQLEGGGK